MENMSAAPHVLPGSRDGFRMGDTKLVDSMIVDGLWDVYNQYHMGITGRERRQGVRHHARGAGRVRRGLPEQGRGRPEGGPVRRGNRAGADSAAQGRPGGVQDRRIRAPGRHAGQPVRPEARLRQGRHGDGRQRLWPQRRRRRRGGDVGRQGQGAGPDPAGHHQGLRQRRRGPGRDGHGPGAGQQALPVARRLGSARTWT